ncbi:helix-turn-helix domain-containing protein [Ligilactobacillus agilis]|uniref:helix-turn-helix domain-containing protein n=1 Tax=Ligilactobacillus agilis TaxID=1601 RepID=UPI000B8D7214|nr:XRE family transcriptional regulator [Ligilactobacillus agilis]ASR40591.1 transcriptional regulator [Ligilactobacillus agilis]
MEKRLFNGKQLTFARKARGLTMKALAEQANISRQMISSYESGKTIPTGKNILKLAQVLDFPSSFFSREVEALTSDGMFFRSQSAATKRARDMQKMDLTFSNSIYNLLKKYVEFPVVNLPQLYVDDYKELTSEIIKDKATELREIWGIDNNSPIPNLIRIMEANGFIVTKSNMENPKIDAVSKWVLDRPFVIFTDNGESAVRRRFNAAHEIGHIILHSEIESIYNLNATELKKIEKQANEFASYFLLPDDAFLDSLVTINLEGFIQLKKYWLVSIGAMVMKTYNLGILNDNQYTYIQKKMSKNRWKKVEPLDNELNVEQPSVFLEVYKMLVESGLFNNISLNTKIGLPQDYLRNMIGDCILVKPKATDDVHLRLIK